MRQRTPGDHRNRRTAGGNHRGHNQRSLVANPTSRVLVDLWHRQLIVRQNNAGMEHLHDQRRRLPITKPAQKPGHEPGRHLIVRDPTIRITSDQKGDLISLEFSAVTLLFNQILWPHLLHSCFPAMTNVRSPSQS